MIMQYEYEDWVNPCTFIKVNQWTSEQTIQITLGCRSLNLADFDPT